MNIAKKILDKYAKDVVIPNLKSNIRYDLGAERPWKVTAKWKARRKDYLYSSVGFRDDLCLWVPPADSLTIEFEGSRTQNDEWISQTKNKAAELGMEFCIADHCGKSAYLWIFNVEGMSLHAQRKALAKLLIPAGAKIDLTNLGRTLVPTLCMKHWKHRDKHRIVEGVLPWLQKNEFPAAAVNLMKRESAVIHSSSCDDINVVAPDNEKVLIDKILKSDFLVQRLMSGNISAYPSPSEARMALLTCLAGYGLSGGAILFVMSQSVGLHYREKKHLQVSELEKARNICKKRVLYC